jgi:hypothetical protein
MFRICPAIVQLAGQPNTALQLTAFGAPMLAILQRRCLRRAAAERQAVGRHQSELASDACRIVYYNTTRYWHNGRCIVSHE